MNFTLAFNNCFKNTNSNYKNMQHKTLKNVIACGILGFLFSFSLPVMAQNENDISTAETYAKKYKEDDILCTSSYQFFTFDKGKNSLNDKVVEIQEDAEYEFLSLKKFSSMTYPEFYNKFIQLKTFKRAFKYGNKYITSDRGGIDRSVTDDGIFFDDSRVQFYPLRFNQKGDMARITVKKTFTDGKYLTRLFFNSPYPIKEQVIEFKVPEWLTVDFKRMNFEGSKIEVKETTKGGYTNYVFIMKDVPAYKSEYRRIGKAFTDPHIIVQIKSFESKGEVLKGFDKVDDVYNWNNRLYLMAGNEKEKLTAQLSKITAGKTNDIEKIKAIYYWVQDNVRYIAYEDGYSGYIPSSAQDVLAKKYGDCKGMANLLTEMMKLSGYDAHFTWIGTRHIPYPQSTPALCVNNHAICTLNYGGKTYYLDGTESYVPFGENAFRIQGKEVMIANGDKFEIKTVPPTTANDNKIYTKADFVLANESLNGKVKVTITGNERTDFHQSYQDLPTSSQKDYLNDYLEFGNDNMVATNVKTSDLKNRDLPVVIEGDVDLSNTVNTISGDKYVGVDFFPKTLDKFIPDEKRVAGYDLDVLVKFEDEIGLTIPADKKFIDKPDNLELKFDGYEFKGEYTITGNKMVLKKELSIKNSIIKKTDFPNWIKFIESIKEFNKYFLSITKK
ncbi:transglutaminase-like domain-containing protein [Ferruginibacter sp.]